MHSYNSKDNTVTFHHNSDFSGEVIICDMATGNEFKVSGEGLLEFVAYRYILSNRISKIESMDYKELLK